MTVASSPPHGRPRIRILGLLLALASSAATALNFAVIAWYFASAGLRPVPGIHPMGRSDAGIVYLAAVVPLVELQLVLLGTLSAFAIWRGWSTHRAGYGLYAALTTCISVAAALAMVRWLAGELRWHYLWPFP